MPELSMMSGLVLADLLGAKTGAGLTGARFRSFSASPSLCCRGQSGSFLLCSTPLPPSHQLFLLPVSANSCLLTQAGTSSFPRLLVVQSWHSIVLPTLRPLQDSVGTLQALAVGAGFLLPAGATFLLPAPGVGLPCRESWLRLKCVRVMP